MFVILSAAMPSRLLRAFPPGVQVSRVPLDEAIARVRGRLFAEGGSEPVADGSVEAGATSMPPGRSTGAAEAGGGAQRPARPPASLLGAQQLAAPRERYSLPR